MRYYIWLLYCLIMTALSYLERWLDYGQYTIQWFIFVLGAIFFLALMKHQIQVDRDEADKKPKRKNDNPFK